MAIKMTVYIFMLMGVIVFGIPLCSKKCGTVGKIIYCALAAIVFIFISSVRFAVGYDYVAYGSMYVKMAYCFPEDLLMSREEKGFLLPLYALSLAFENYVTVFVYTSIIIYGATFFLVYKNSSCPWISIASYLCFGLFFNSLCFLRQVIAAIIVLYAMKFIDSRNPIKFFVLVIAASTFHWSALIMLVVYFFLKIKPGYIYLGIITAGTVIFCLFSKKFMFWAIEHFSMYKGYNPETNVEATTGLAPRYTIMFGILFIICFAFRKKLIEKNPKNGVYINCLMYTTVFEAMGMRHAILSRFAILVYMAPVLYLLPDAVFELREYISEKFSGRERLSRIFGEGAMTALALFSVGCYFILMLNNYNGVVPYVSQFNRPYDIFIEKVIEDEDYDPDWFEYDDEYYDDEYYDDEEWLEYYYDEDYDDEEWFDDEDWFNDEDYYEEDWDGE